MHNILKHRSKLVLPATVLTPVLLGIAVFLVRQSQLDQRLVRATADNNAVAVERLLKQGAHSEATDRQIDYSVLSMAASVGNDKIVKLLLDHGANVNRQDHHGLTALMEAASDAHPGTVALLLSYGADPTIKNTSGLTALDIALMYRPYTRLRFPKRDRPLYEQTIHLLQHVKSQVGEAR